MGMKALYLSLLRKYEEAYREALSEGNAERARVSALQCAGLFRKLASEDLQFSHYYLEQAAEWEKRAKEPAVLGTGPKRFGGEVERVKALIQRTGVSWDDVGGLREAKKLLAQTVGVALARTPKGFKPWRGVLLFGPPGTGKSLLASALAGSLRATFLNVGISDVLSKYFGESTRLASAIYELARERSPSVVFIDEFDALAIKRSGMDDAARRVLASILEEMDGFKDPSLAGKHVVTLAATNAPWDLDEAVLSRLPMRIYVPLPDEGAAEEILRIHLRGIPVGVNLKAVARLAVRRLYSGREIANLCSLATLRMLEEMNPELGDPLKVGSIAGKTLTTRPLEARDFNYAFRRVKSPVKRALLKKYEKWAEEYGV